MSRKGKTLRAFLHQNPNPTVKQAWDAAWKHAQKAFHARSMQDLEEKLAAVQAECEKLRAKVVELRNLRAELLEEPINVSYIDGNGAARSKPADCRYGISYVIVADTIYWPLSSDDAQRLHSAECGNSDFTGPTNECPDVSALVEELHQSFPLLDDKGLDKDEHHCEWSIQQERKRLHAILAAHRKAYKLKQQGQKNNE